LLDLGVLRYRTPFIVAKKKVLKKHAIGYCSGRSLLCRLKVGFHAVMFQKGEQLFWTHLTIKEFNLVLLEK